ncbi:SDR family NAD(P)-dependent oxidoreductase [Pseudotenacibaculum sp. MALMAid0570]|uniref:SDR family NAD(P)-dependent oxidoreductase n=1 Tax=Pseudotenacibaculum sp. MALMAid0570 TaxID=3143938 RepID=UPI0032E02A07
MTKRDFTTKNFLLVAANGGLGRETAKHLINDGATKITLAGRTLSKIEEAKRYLKKTTTQNPLLELKTAGGFDMLDPKKIETAINNLETKNPFDIVFLCAGGVFFTNDYQTKKWNQKEIEKTVFQNVFGAHLTIKALKQQNLLSPNALVVFAGGEGARGIPGMIASPEFRSKSELREYIFKTKETQAKYNPMNAIGVSKLFGALWVSKIASLDNSIDAIWFTPGLTSGTNGLSGMTPLKRWFMKHLVFGFMNLIGKAQSPSKGGRKFADCLEGKIGANGDLLGAPKGQTLGRLVDQKPMNPAFTNNDLIDEFWLITEELFGKF